MKRGIKQYLSYYVQTIWPYAVVGNTSKDMVSERWQKDGEISVYEKNSKHKMCFILCTLLTSPTLDMAFSVSTQNYFPEYWTDQ